MFNPVQEVPSDQEETEGRPSVTQSNEESKEEWTAGPTVEMTRIVKENTSMDMSEGNNVMNKLVDYSEKTPSPS